MLNGRRLGSVAFVLGAGFVLVATGCDSVLGTSGGSVRFVLSAGGDAAVLSEVATLGEEPMASEAHDGDGHHGRLFESANVTFSSILARNEEGVLVDVDMELPVMVDVLSLDNGKEVTLPEGQLPPGTYDQVVIVMTHVEGVTADSTTIAITPGGGGWTAIIPLCPFMVEGDGPTTVTINFDLDQAFSLRDSRYHFNPHFTCEAEDG
jgi:hypothetical protein